jgi:hypothetical protein
MQAGIANVTQESKSAANKTGEKGQSMLNQTGETLQQINPFKSWSKPFLNSFPSV